MDLRCDYGRIAPSYDRYRDLSPATLKRWLSKIIQLGEIGPAMRVLDIGCGTGRLTIPLQRLTGAEVFGLDLSKEMLEQAQQKAQAEAVNWVLGDAQALPFPEGFFDCAFMCLVLHHFEDKARAIEEMHRVLVPGGRSLIWTVSHRQIRESPLNEFFLSLSKIDRARFPAVRRIKALMKSAGFTAIRAEPVAFQEQVSTSCYLEKVRNKYISTLTLLSAEEFAAGLEKLERSLLHRGGRRMARESRFTIVTGRKIELYG